MGRSQAISLYTNSLSDVHVRKGPKRFFFEHKWMTDDNLFSILDQWKDCGSNEDLPKKLSLFSGVLKSWVGTRFFELP